jgi:hypothetical protein
MIPKFLSRLFIERAGGVDLRARTDVSRHVESVAAAETLPSQVELDCQIVGPRDAVDEFRAAIETHAGISIRQSGVIRDANHLSLDLLVLSTLSLAIYSATFAPLVPSIFAALRAKPRSWLELRTPWKTIRISSSDDLTEEQVVKLVKTLVETKRDAPAGK